MLVRVDVDGVLRCIYQSLYFLCREACRRARVDMRRVPRGFTVLSARSEIYTCPIRKAKRSIDVIDSCSQRSDAKFWTVSRWRHLPPSAARIRPT